MKIFTAFLLLASINIFFIEPAYSGWVGGNDLLEKFEAKKDDDLGYRSGAYDGYVSGVADLSVDVLWCPPKSITGGQIKKIVAKYLKAHPEMLHKNADSLVINALKKPFPCKK
jgi:hypothetical protein